MKNEQINKLAGIIKEKFHPEKIILFGSHAWGDPASHSDVDLMVIMETNLKPYEQAACIRILLDECFPDLMLPVDILVRTPKEVEERIRLGDFFIKRVISKGIVL